MKSISLRLLAITMVVTLIAPAFGTVEAQRAERDASRPATASALVSGAYRMIVHQTSIVEDPSTIGVAGTGPVVASLVDVTNLGAPGILDPTIVSVGTFEVTPLEVVDGTGADAESSISASIHAELSLDGNFAVAENSNIRLILVFPFSDATDDSKLGFRVADQVASLEQTMVDEIDTDEVPPLQPTMDLRIADVTGAPGSGQLSVVFRDGVADDVTITGINTPDAGTSGIPGCFFNESSAAITAMTGGTVWLEEDADGYLVWINNPSMGIFDLLQARIVQEGFGGANDSDTSSYSSWLGASTDWAQSEGLGLWTDCTSASGDWKVQPTAAPLPTKTPEEIRADYQWIDSRDLVIRPGTFEGQKIAITGSVFNIDVEGDLTVMQIWLDGGREAAVVAYWGDSMGIYEGTWVTVYGVGNGTFEGTNAFGGTISQPLVVAEIVDW